MVLILALLGFGAGAAFIVLLASRPTSQTLGGVDPAPATMDLGPEPPAVVNALVNRGVQGRAAIPATFLDLAARGHLAIFQPFPAPAIVYRRDSTDPLRDYERLFLTPIESTSPEHGIPLADYIDRLGFGVSSSIEFERSVHAELLASNLLHRAGGFISWESLTAEGRTAASHWLGVREFLRGDDAFHELPPSAVTVWDRYLAYAAALDVAYDATSEILAMFARHATTTQDVDAARTNLAAYFVSGSQFDARDFGVSPTAPFGPVGPYPTNLRGLLAGWTAAGHGEISPTTWGTAFVDRVELVQTSAPAAAAADVAAVLDALVDASRSGHAGLPLDQVFRSIEPVMQRFFADATARAGEGSDEVRRWNILRRLAH